MSEVDDQIKQLVETVASQHQGTTETLRLLAEQTNRQIQDMHTGADKMRLAAERFEHAGDRVSEANHLTADVLNKAQSAGSSLSLATSELTSVVADYRNNREAVSKSIAMLELLAANTQSEQTTRTQFIADLKQHGERLQSYNREAQAFMENVSDVLGKGLKTSEGVSRSPIKRWANWTLKWRRLLLCSRVLSNRSEKASASLMMSCHAFVPKG